MIEIINLNGWYPNFMEVSDINRYMVEEWKVNYVLDSVSALEFFENIDQKKWEKLKNIAKKKSEKMMTEAMVDFEIHSIQVSQLRRAYIIDQTAVAYAWMKRASVNGDVLDIGCQNGISLTYLARCFPNNFHGIDPSENSIVFAQNRNKQISNLRFDVGELPKTIFGKYDLVLCNDVLHHLKDKDQCAAVGSIFSSLNDGMTAIISTHDFQDQSWWDAIQPAMSEHGISLIAAGMVGGCLSGGDGDIPANWASTGLGVFRKTGTTDPVDAEELKTAFSSHWTTFFAPYAIDASTHWPEKTMAYEASRRSI